MQCSLASAEQPANPYGNAYHREALSSDSTSASLQTHCNSVMLVNSQKASMDVLLNAHLIEEIRIDIRKDLSQAMWRVTSIPDSALREYMFDMIKDEAAAMPGMECFHLYQDLNQEWSAGNIRSKKQVPLLEKFRFLRYSDTMCTGMNVYKLPPVYDVDFITQSTAEWNETATLPGNIMGIFIPKQILLQALSMGRVLQRAIRTYPKCITCPEETSSILLLLIANIMHTAGGSAKQPALDVSSNT